MIQYRIYTEKIIVAGMAGDVSFDELLEWLYILFSWDDYLPTFSVIADQRKANVTIGQEDVRKLVLVNKDIPLLRGRWACLALAPAVDSLSRVYRSVKIGLFEIEFFLTLGAASDYVAKDVGEMRSDFERRSDPSCFSLTPGCR